MLAEETLPCSKASKTCHPKLNEPSMQLTRLGPYEIGKPLGKGGMGSVYEAVDTQTGQEVAVKALAPHLATAEGFRERFEAEIESLKTLKHDGIVRLYGYGEQDGVLFYSMELVRGVSLEDELRGGRRFNWREVSQIAIQLCMALKHAHDHGIVHRDIKPANILLADDEHVKLADFGIARLFGMNQLTSAGGVLGTADYMSPEQADGRPVTARCDQYSLGGVLYALLAGRPPFRAKNLPQMLQLQRFAEPEPVRRYAPDAPEQLESVIMQLLAKEPNERFPNMQVLARHLQAMVMALSRPAADDFALSSDPPADRPAKGWDHSMLAAQTQAEPVSEPPASSDAGDGSAINNEPTSKSDQSSMQDATTLAAEEFQRQQTGRAAVGLSLSGRTSVAQGVKPPPIERPSRFTTVEQEEARRRLHQPRSWPPLLAQLAGLAAVLASIVGLTLYVSQPSSADQLYERVTAQAKGVEPDSLAVRRNVEEFLRRFPADARVAELKALQQRIELDKNERRLRRSNILDPSLLPVERQFLRTVSLAETSPEQAFDMLKSLVDLYGTTTVDIEQLAEPTDEQTRTADCVRMAERRLVTLREDIARERARQLKSLEERMDSAGKIATSDTTKAAAMYEAVIDLYQGQAWAEEVVADARERLAKMKLLEGSHE